MIMQDLLTGIFLIIVVIALMMPYYSLLYLKDIADILEKIQKELERKNRNEDI